MGFNVRHGSPHNFICWEADMCILHNQSLEFQRKHMEKILSEQK